MRIARSVIIALIVALLLGGWLLSGALRDAREEEEQAGAPQPQREEVLTKVRARVFTAEQRQADLIIRGRSESNRTVEVAAETVGAVVDTPAEEGAPVTEGDVICRLDQGAREQQLAEARAVLRQRELEFKAAQELRGSGFRSETQAAAARSALEAARTIVRTIEIDIENTEIKAPFDGLLDRRTVEVGDFMRVGSVCGTVIDTDPFLIVGQVAEKDVGLLRIGERGQARLVTGETVDGRIDFIAKRADAATRTFRVELQVPNPDGSLRDGVTAEIRVPVRSVRAHRLSPAYIVLNDRGIIGVRTVDPSSTVVFRAVTIISDTGDGVWVTGLPEEVTIITVGQEFVTNGQRVDVTIDEGLLEETGDREGQGIGGARPGFTGQGGGQ